MCMHDRRHSRRDTHCSWSLCAFSKCAALRARPVRSRCRGWPQLWQGAVRKPMVIGKPIFRDRTRRTHQVRPQMAWQHPLAWPPVRLAVHQRIRTRLRSERPIGASTSVADTHVQHAGCPSGCFVVDTAAWNDTVSADFSKISGATHLWTPARAPWHIHPARRTGTTLLR